MKLFAIICTRDKAYGAVTQGLLFTLSSFGVNVKIMAGQESIFSAYQKGLDICNADDEDIIILCHDDIQIQSTRPEFIAAVGKCLDKETGIIGVAGTTFLGKDSVWWNHDRWNAGYHRGEVQHVHAEKRHIYTSYYGPHGQVVVLDGLFLAAKKEVWDKIGLTKPTYFTGNWDFYDIHYTTQSHLLGYKNYTVPISIIHKSGGSLVGRDSWLNNREAYEKHTNLPISVSL